MPSGSAPDARRAGVRGTDLGSAGLLLGGLRALGGLLARGLGATLLAPRDATAGVQDLLLARVERVAVRADLGVDRATGRGAPGGERVPAAAGHRGDVVLRVDVSLHGQTPAFGGRRVARESARREPVPRGCGFLVCQIMEPLSVTWHSPSGAERGLLDLEQELG